MSAKVKDNTTQLLREIEINASVALRLMCDAVVVDSTPNTPQDKGNLRRDILKQVLGLSGKITWAKNYAVFQESKQYRSYTTSGTGPHFAENAVKKVVKDQDVYFRKAGLR